MTLFGILRELEQKNIITTQEVVELTFGIGARYIFNGKPLRFVTGRNQINTSSGPVSFDYPVDAALTGDGELFCYAESCC